MANVFVTGGTGYIGSATIRALLARGQTVKALVRAGSESRLPPGAQPFVGNALAGDSFAAAIEAGDTFLQLVGTPKPSPAKANEFERVDLVSVGESVRVSRERGVTHFVYLSVAQPAPVMKAYVAVRARGEALLRDSGLPFTALRPWYVLGPGHYWPYVLVPLYWVARRVPSLRDGAQRLGLITLGEMVAAIVRAVEQPSRGGGRVVEVGGLRGERVSG
jgi:uncharacterized protein YbjT (DUF2867 family)